MITILIKLDCYRLGCWLYDIYIFIATEWVFILPWESIIAIGTRCFHNIFMNIISTKLRLYKIVAYTCCSFSLFWFACKPIENKNLKKKANRLTFFPSVEIILPAKCNKEGKSFEWGPCVRYEDVVDSFKSFQFTCRTNKSKAISILEWKRILWNAMKCRRGWSVSFLNNVVDIMKLIILMIKYQES